MAESRPGPAGPVLRPGLAVRTRVPASSANLGPGFDSVGLALGLWDTCTVTVREEPGLLIEVEGEGAGQVPTDASHLVHRTMLRAWQVAGVVPPSGLHLLCHNEVPHGRGLGSSATAIVTGISAAHGLACLAAGEGAQPELGGVNDLASALEGHPDNASASVHGGVTLSWPDDDRPGTVTLRLAPHADLEPVVFVPGAQLSTATARSVLPGQVRLADAAANSARAALLVHGLTSDPARLLAATRDWLHQEARRPSYPDSMALVDRLRHHRHAAVISGAGPSVLVLTTRADAEAVVVLAGDQWRVVRPGIPQRGAQVEVAGSSPQSVVEP